MSDDNSFSKIGPFSDNPLMIGYDNRLFDFDTELGYAFPNGQIVGEKGFVDFTDKIAELKKRGDKYLVLNIGDSSTSGWNSDKVYKGCPDPVAALFSYKTYPDILADTFGVATINAGVPGYTTYQAKKQLAKILKTLAQESIYPDYITIYLGNNDCTYNGREDKARIDYKIASSAEILARVSEQDFRQNYDEILALAAEYGATPIVLVPASNYRWQPGLRSKQYPEELERQRQKIGDADINSLFGEAEAAYASGDYETALEKDVLLPRIKKAYKAALVSFSPDALSVDAQQFVQDEGDFVDYCHPNETTNQRIAGAISKLLTKKNMAHTAKVVEQDLPADTYTLY